MKTFYYYLKIFISLIIAAWCTMTMALGATWIKGDCDFVFKIFGGIFFVTALIVLVINFIRTFDIA